MLEDRHKLRYSICVSGAAAGSTVEEDYRLAERLGAAIAKRGHVLTTGATVGLPYYAARGAYTNGGMSIGFSPAVNLREHVRKYRLPRDVFNFVNFTGLHYVGRDSYLVQSSDAVITIGGRFGSLHEFVTALEAHKPCGILKGSNGAADVIPELMKVLEPPHAALVVYEENPEILVDHIIKVLDQHYADIHKQLTEHDEHWFMHPEPKPPRAG